MTRFYTALICAFLAFSAINPTFARRSFGRGGSHSYPHSGGLSGSGSHHSYPKSPGLSGSGGSHGYPSSGGLSGGGSHGYPSSGGGLSGSGSKPSYPSNTQHHSNQHGYPASTGLSGNTHSSPGHTTINNHYHYNPPQQIRYTPVHGGAPVSYPVYHGTPPQYVYQYKDSGSKYSSLLAGLALFNLGALGGYAVGHSTGGGSHSNSNYRPAPGEVCKFGIKKENGDYEETRIDCQLITSFIFQAEAEKQNNPSTNTTVVTTTVTNVTMINTTNNNEVPAPAAQVEPNFTMLPNGTLVPMNATASNETVAGATAISPANETDNKAADAAQVTSSVVVTNTTTTVTNAVDVKGPPVQVTPGMQCYVIRNTPSSNMKKTVPCIISVCWVAGAGVGFLPLFGWHAAVDPHPDCYFVEVMDYNFLLFLYLATIITPSVLLVLFYAHIYRVVVKQMSGVMTVENGNGRVTGGTMLRVLGAAQKREVKATQNLAVIVFFFIICWIPLYTINAITAFMPELNIPSPLTDFCIILSHLNSAINPLLYAYHLKDFRAAMKGLICSMFGRGVPLPAAYRPPAPMRRPALERSNALRERPRVYVNSPVWLRQKEAEVAGVEERNGAVATSTPVRPEMEPFLNRAVADGSSGRHTPEGRENDLGPYLIDKNQERCQSPYRKVEELLRRVRSVHSDHS